MRCSLLDIKEAGGPAPPSPTPHPNPACGAPNFRCVISLSDDCWGGRCRITSAANVRISKPQPQNPNPNVNTTVVAFPATGRPLRILKTDYVLDWEQNRQDEIRELTGKGTLPAQHDLGQKQESGEDFDMIEYDTFDTYPLSFFP